MSSVITAIVYLWLGCSQLQQYLRNKRVATELGRKRPSCLVYVTDIRGQEWPSSLGDSVTLSVIQRASILTAAAVLPFVPTAVAAGPQSTTVVVQEAKVGLDKYVGATELSDAELADLLKLVGFEGKSLKMAWAIVKRESRGHPLSHNVSSATGDNSYGLFQINMIGSLGDIRREKFGIKTDAELLDPVANAKAAYYMSAHGTNFGSWGLGPDAYDGNSSEPAVTAWLIQYPS